MPFAAVNGIRIHHEVRGSGPRLLFLNGTGTTVETTRVMVDPYADRFTVLALDQRGLGRTTVPAGPFSMADYAADALGLLDHLGWDTVRVVGTSFGGMVAQELAVTAPERVERLALVCTSPGGEFASSPLHELDDLPAEARAARWPTLLDTRFTPGWLAEHPDDAAFLALAGSRPVSDDPEVARGRREQLLARSGHDVVDRLGRITCPTLVAAGRTDGIAPLVNSEAIAARIPGAELRIYDGGHIFFMLNPQVVPDVIGFLLGD